MLIRKKKNGGTGIHCTDCGSEFLGKYVEKTWLQSFGIAITSPIFYYIFIIGPLFLISWVKSVKNTKQYYNLIWDLIKGFKNTPGFWLKIRFFAKTYWTIIRKLFPLATIWTFTACFGLSFLLSIRALSSKTKGYIINKKT